MHLIPLLFLLLFSPIAPLCGGEQTTAQGGEAPLPEGAGKGLPLPAYGESHFYDELVNMLITLGFILLIFIALAWIMKRMQATRVRYGNDSSAIKVVDQRSFSPKSTLYLLKVYDKALLVADSANGITAIAEFPAGEMHAKSANGSAFEELLDK